MLPMLEQYANYSLHDLFLKQKTTHGQLFIVRSISDLFIFLVHKIKN
jgi:hypothetical protein